MGLAGGFAFVQQMPLFFERNKMELSRSLMEKEETENSLFGYIAV